MIEDKGRHWGEPRRVDEECRMKDGQTRQREFLEVGEILWEETEDVINPADVIKEFGGFDLPMW